MGVSRSVVDPRETSAGESREGSCGVVCVSGSEAPGVTGGLDVGAGAGALRAASRSRRFLLICKNHCKTLQHVR